MINSPFVILFEEKKTKGKLLDSFRFGAVKPTQSHYKEPNRKNIKTLIQQFVIPDATDITDNGNPFEKKIPQDDTPFHSDLSKNNNNTSTSENRDNITAICKFK